MFLKNLKIEPTYDPAIPLLGIYLQKTIIWKDTCTLMFTEALFTIAKTWKQTKCPLTEEWIKKMWLRTFNGISLSHKKNKIMPFAATWMDLEIFILREVRQRKTNIIWYCLYLETKKSVQIEPIYKKEIESQV